MKVLFLPDWRQGNPYQALLAAAVQDNGCEVDFCNFPEGAWPLQKALRAHPGTQVLHLHWVNQLIGASVWAGSPVKRWLRRTLLWLDVALARLRGVRVVWTVHNYTSHDSEDPHAELRARHTLARSVDHLILHSEGALAKIREGWGAAGLESLRTSIVRHGNFDGCYPPDERLTAALRAQWDVQGDATVVLFFGAIRPYKGLEAFVQTLVLVPDARLRLVIAGKPHTAAFGDLLRGAAAQDPRIILRFEFIPDADVAAHYAAADAVAVPLQQTLTSGSAVLAMTMGRPLLMPSSTRHLDLGGPDCVLHYDDEEDLARLLDSLPALDLAGMGQRCAAAARDWNWSTVGRQTALAYLG